MVSWSRKGQRSPTDTPVHGTLESPHPGVHNRTADCFNNNNNYNNSKPTYTAFFCATNTSQFYEFSIFYFLSNRMVRTENEYNAGWEVSAPTISTKHIKLIIICRSGHRVFLEISTSSWHLGSTMMITMITMMILHLLLKSFWRTSQPAPTARPLPIKCFLKELRKVRESVK